MYVSAMGGGLKSTTLVVHRKIQKMRLERLTLKYKHELATRERNTRAIYTGA